jgi:hypothetical protein
MTASVFVPGLLEENFRVFEDKVEQKLVRLQAGRRARQLRPGVDNSGSMRDKRPQVNAAALTFVKLPILRMKASSSISTTTTTSTPSTISPAT